MKIFMMFFSILFLLTSCACPCNSLKKKLSEKKEHKFLTQEEEIFLSKLSANNKKSFKNLSPIQRAQIIHFSETESTPPNQAVERFLKNQPNGQ